jgi:hypothetical protein
VSRADAGRPGEGTAGAAGAGWLGGEPGFGPAFRDPPRHAPGFPAGCADTGDALALTAAGTAATLTLAVVTSALRATVEESADHEAGLDRVRRSLASAGRALAGRWSASYFGKDLVLVSTPTHPEPYGSADEVGRAVAGHTDPAVRHGWAWRRVRLAGPPDERREALFRAAYLVSLAARLRRDRPGTLPGEADEALRRVPGLLDAREAAGLLAGVLVRPLGSAAAGPPYGTGDDPRFPGVPSADGWREAARRPPAGAVHVVTDVHDIEWGAPGGAHPVPGNASELLPLATDWVHERLAVEEVVPRAYERRVGRESGLWRHLRALRVAAARDGGSAYAVFGDGVAGFLPSVESARAVVSAANSATDGRVRSGLGAAVLDGAGVPRAARRAAFSLHVTKALKGTGLPGAACHVFGEPLTGAAAEAATAFLTGLAVAGPAAAGRHHLAHARRWAAEWRAHLPPADWAGLRILLSEAP